MRTSPITGALLVLSMLAPAPALADGLATPFVGAAFPEDAESSKLTLGGGFGFMAGGFVGFEYDFGYTRDFFDKSNAVGDNSVITSMFNAIVGIPGGRYPEYGPSLRPYLTGGLGLIHTRMEAPEGNVVFRDNDLGMNIGGGLLAFFNNSLGLRGDVRYVRNLSDPEEDNQFDVAFGEFDYWRATLGVVLRY